MGLVLPLKSIAGIGNARTLGEFAPGDQLDPGYVAVNGVNSQSANYTLALSDGTKHILHPQADNNARIFTIPANSSVAFPVGTQIWFVNERNTVTIAITTDTLMLSPTGTTGNRTLAANGMAMALKITATKWMISGYGLS